MNERRRELDERVRAQVAEIEDILGRIHRKNERLRTLAAEKFDAILAAASEGKAGPVDRMIADLASSADEAMPAIAVVGGMAERILEIERLLVGCTERQRHVARMALSALRHERWPGERDGEIEALEGVVSHARDELEVARRGLLRACDALRQLGGDAQAEEIEGPRGGDFYAWVLAERRKQRATAAEVVELRKRVADLERRAAGGAS